MSDLTPEQRESLYEDLTDMTGRSACLMPVAAKIAVDILGPRIAALDAARAEQADARLAALVADLQTACDLWNERGSIHFTAEIIGQIRSLIDRHTEQKD